MSMRSGPANRDPNFRGIDPAALGQVIQQLRQAATGIEQWLRANPAPAGVSGEGYQQARAVQQWITEQLGMLTRRRNLALSQREDPDITKPTTPDLGREVTPTAPDSGSGSAAGLASATSPDPQSTTDPAQPGQQPNGNKPDTAQPAPQNTTDPAQPDQQPDDGEANKPDAAPPGTGSDLGAFATTDEAIKEAVADAYATNTSLQGGSGGNGTEVAVAAGIWKNLAEHAKDPEYTAAYYERLGPEGIVRLIQAADGDPVKLKAITESLTTANNQLHMNSQWVAAMLGEADRLGNRTQVVELLQATPLAPKLDDAVAVADSAKLTTAAKAS